MINWGNVPAGAVLPFYFDTFAGATGASITLTGLAVTDIEVVKGTSVTPRASDNGYTLLDTDGIDIGSRTGIHGFTIDTGDNSDAGFYATGSYFTVIVDAVTVDSQTVRFVIGTFRLMGAESSAGVPQVDVERWNGTAVPAEHTAGYPVVTIKDGTGTGEIDTNAGQVALTAASRAAIVDEVLDEDMTGHQTQGTLGQAIGDPGADTNSIYKAVVTDADGATVGADTTSIISTIDTNTTTINNIETQIGVAGAGLTDLGGMSTTMKAQVQVEANDAIVANRLNELIVAEYTFSPTAGSIFSDMIESDGGVARFNANALEQGPTGGGGVADWTADQRTALSAILGIPASGTTPEAPSAGGLKTIIDKQNSIARVG